MLRLLLLTLLCLPLAARARTMPAASIPAPSAMCRAGILEAERTSRVPDRLLDAISVVESGRRDPISGAIYAWPWTINAEGVGHFYETKAEAIAAVQAFQARGIRSMDVGCLQVNLMYHPTAFASLDQAFDPVANAAYGAKFLLQLYSQTNAWPLAAAAYHSFTPDKGAEYAKKVLAAWGVPQLPVGSQVVTSSATQAAPPTPAVPPGRVAVMLPTGSEAIRVLPIASTSQPAANGTSRGLDSYRAAPIGLAARPLRLY